MKLRRERGRKRHLVLRQPADKLDTLITELHSYLLVLEQLPNLDIKNPSQLVRIWDNLLPLARKVYTLLANEVEYLVNRRAGDDLADAAGHLLRTANRGIGDHMGHQEVFINHWKKDDSDPFEVLYNRLYEPALRQFVTALGAALKLAEGEMKRRVNLN